METGHIEHRITPSGTVEVDSRTGEGEFGTVIEQVRRRRGLSLRDLAFQVGCSHAYISMIERGKKCPSAALLERIQHALEIEQIALQTGDGRVEKTTLAKVRIISPQLFAEPLRGDISRQTVAFSPKVDGRLPYDVRVAIIVSALKMQEYDPSYRQPTKDEKKSGIVAVIVLLDLGLGGWEILIKSTD